MESDQCLSYNRSCLNSRELLEGRQIVQMQIDNTSTEHIRNGCGDTDRTPLTGYNFSYPEEGTITNINLDCVSPESESWSNKQKEYETRLSSTQRPALKCVCYRLKYIFTSLEAIKSPTHSELVDILASLLGFDHHPARHLEASTNSSRKHLTVSNDSPQNAITIEIAGREISSSSETPAIVTAPTEAISKWETSTAISRLQKPEADSKSEVEQQSEIVAGASKSVIAVSYFESVNYPLKSPPSMNKDDEVLNASNTVSPKAIPSDRPISNSAHKRGQHEEDVKNTTRRKSNRVTENLKVCSVKTDKDCHGFQQTTFKCEECFKTFTRRALYKRHLRTHGSQFQCDICGKTLKTKDSLYHHRRGLHSNKKPYRCKVCGTTFGFHQSFKLHMQRHNGERPYKCASCGKTYLTNSHLKIHIHAVHKTSKDICHICGKTFAYNCTLKQHLLTHSSSQSHKCNVCASLFSSKQSFKKHSLTHFTKYQYSCAICGKLYKSERSRNAHLKRHEQQTKTFVCDICGKAFWFKNMLKDHMRTHIDSRPYHCPLCPKSFKTRSSLYTHKYVHRESHPYACSICGKTFKTKNCCEAHKKRHMNTKTHACEHCGSMFPDKGGLAKHIKTIHVPKRQFLCKICGKKGTRGDNMRAHVRSHKKELGMLDDSNIKEFIVEEYVASAGHNSFIFQAPRSQLDTNVEQRYGWKFSDAHPLSSSQLQECNSNKLQLVQDTQFTLPVGSDTSFQCFPISASHPTLVHMSMREVHPFSHTTNKATGQQSTDQTVMYHGPPFVQRDSCHQAQRIHHYSDRCNEPVPNIECSSSGDPIQSQTFQSVSNNDDQQPFPNIVTEPGYTTNIA